MDGLQVAIGKRAFDHRLAVIELAVNPNDRHVFADGGHLLALTSRNLVNGKQHHDMDAVHTSVCVGHRAAGIARCGGQNNQLAILTLHE